MKILSLIFALLVVLSCSNEDDALLCNEKATLRDFTGVDGCSYVLVLDDEKVLEIGDLEFEPDFQFRDGLRVSVTYEEVSSVSICMVGQIVRVLCIDPI
tara:strand:+ start:141 stop:437 length:297 start_codon:yes stop_codon:yes gene_type:complete